MKSEWEKKPAIGYLIDIHTREKLEFQYNPSSFSDEKATTYATIQIPGISHPRYQYVAGQARRINFKLELFKGPVKKKVNWIQSLQYPEHAGTMLKNAPHKVLLVFGDLFPGVTCIVRSVSVKYFGLFDRDKLLPQQAEVDISLEEVCDQSVQWKDVRK